VFEGHVSEYRVTGNKAGQRTNLRKQTNLVHLKGIVSRDFEVCFLVPLDSSDIATPDGMGLFFKIKSISCRIFDFSGLGAGSLPCERISAQGAAAAHVEAVACERQKNGVQI
jgi:hypothetical protein